MKIETLGHHAFASNLQATTASPQGLFERYLSTTEGKSDHENGSTFAFEDIGMLDVHEPITRKSKETSASVSNAALTQNLMGHPSFSTNTGMIEEPVEMVTAAVKHGPTFDQTVSKASMQQPEAIFKSGDGSAGQDFLLQREQIEGLIKGVVTMAHKAETGSLNSIEIESLRQPSPVRTEALQTPNQTKPSVVLQIVSGSAKVIVGMPKLPSRLEPELKRSVEIILAKFGMTLASLSLNGQSFASAVPPPLGE